MTSEALILDRVEYCNQIGRAVSGLAQAIIKDPSLLLPQEKPLFDGRVLAMGGGAALTLNEARGERCLKTELAAQFLQDGGYFFGRAHGQIDKNRLPEVLQRGDFIPPGGYTLSKTEIDWLLKDPNISMSIDQVSGRQCAAHGMGDGHPGILGALSGLESFVRQLRTIMGDSLDVSKLDLGVEIPGGLIIRPDFTIEKDIPLLVRHGIATTGDMERDEDIRKGMWLTCVDERVSHKQDLSTNSPFMVEPASSFPHAAAAIGIFDIDDPVQRALAVAAGRLQQPDKNQALGVLSSGCLGYVGPFARLPKQERIKIIDAMARLYWYTRSGYSQLTVYENDVAQDIQQASLNDQVFATPQDYSFFGRQTTIPFMFKRGLLTDEEVKHMQRVVDHESLSRRPIPIIKL